MAARTLGCYHVYRRLDVCGWKLPVRCTQVARPLILPIFFIRRPPFHDHSPLLFHDSFLFTDFWLGRITVLVLRNFVPNGPTFEPTMVPDMKPASTEAQEISFNLDGHMYELHREPDNDLIGTVETLKLQTL